MPTREADSISTRPSGAVPVGDPELDLLTPRERDVLRLLARGYAYKEIAAELSRWASDRRLV